MKGKLIQEKYQILKILGHSVFSETFLAKDKGWFARHRYIIKKIRPILGNPKVEAMRRMFYHEASILKRLSGNNPQIPRLHEYFMDGEDFYLVREWIDGLTLQQKVEREGKLSVEQVEDILKSILSFLEYIHSYNIVYRQLKPSTIVLRQNRHFGKSSGCLPVPIYFGGVKELEEEMQRHRGEASISVEGEGKAFQSLGNGLDAKRFVSQTAVFEAMDYSIQYSLIPYHQQYIPPEQERGKSVLQSDLYSLGLTAIYLLTGKNPDEFPVDPYTKKLLWHREIPWLKNNLVRVIERAIFPEIDRRYTSAKQMIDALNSPTVNLSIPLIESPPQKKHFASEAKIITLLSSLGIGVLGLTFLILNLDFQLKKEALDRTVDVLKVDTLPVERPASPASTSTSASMQRSLSTAIPTFPLGMTQQSIINLLGEPTANKSGYWQNSRAMLYENIVFKKIDFGYLTDIDTTRVRQAEIAFAGSVDLLTIKQEVKRLLHDHYSSEIDHYIDRVYFKTSDRHDFSMGNFQGVVQRNPREYIYVAVWDRGFHQ